MNERIRDLQIQAFAECKTFEDDKIRTDEVFERFAELIVRKCADIAFDEYAATNGESSGESAILKHFGVKEKMNTLEKSCKQALEFCEFLWREVSLNDYCEYKRNQLESSLRAALAQQAKQVEQP